MSPEWLSVGSRPRGQGTTSPLSNDYWIKEVRRASGRIGDKSGEHTICNNSCLLVARIARRQLLYIVFAGHPRFKLLGVRDHVLNLVTPSAALLTIKDDVSDRGHADFGLA